LARRAGGEQVIDRPQVLGTVIDEQFGHAVRAGPEPHERVLDSALTACFRSLGINLEDFPGELVPDLPDGAAGRELQHRRFHHRGLGIVQNTRVLGYHGGLLKIQHATLERTQGVGQPLGQRHRDTHRRAAAKGVNASSAATSSAA
jgi:hypothetical protein